MSNLVIAVGKFTKRHAKNTYSGNKRDHSRSRSRSKSRFDPILAIITTNVAETHESVNPGVKNIAVFENKSSKNAGNVNERR